MTGIIALRGLPGSGKSTWAKEWVKKSKEPCAIVSRDSIRKMLGVPWSMELEVVVKRIKTYMIKELLKHNYTVVVDDINLNMDHISHLEEIQDDCNKHSAILGSPAYYNVIIPSYIRAKLVQNIVIIDFTDVPLETCIERDSKRDNPIGEDVIRSLHHNFIETQEIVE